MEKKTSKMKKKLATFLMQYPVPDLTKFRDNSLPCCLYLQQILQQWKHTEQWPTVHNQV